MAKKRAIAQLDAESIENPLVLEEREFVLKDIASGYVDNSMKNSGGVTAMDGELDIRPKFQRSFIVEDNEDWKTNLIDSIINGRPIGVIYFGVKKD